MKYQIYQGNTKCRIEGFVPYMIAESQKNPKHREEITAYLSNMEEPTLDFSITGSRPNRKLEVEFNFTPMSDEMAEWFVNSKTVYFQTVRNTAHSHSSNKSRGDRDGGYPGGVGKWYDKETFPYGFKWTYNEETESAGYGKPLQATIPNAPADRLVMRFTKEELMSGTISRDMSHILSYKNHVGNLTAKFQDVDHQFYVGFIYYDSSNKPALFKLAEMNLYDSLM